MARKRRPTRLPAPFLKRLSVIDGALEGADGYPFDLTWLRGGTFSLTFETPVTVIVGENGTGKSTLIEAIAALSGYDQAGGGKGYSAVDHRGAREVNGGLLAGALRAAWLPKVTDGWFFRAESFFSVARYLDAVGSTSADFLSMSHGEGFLRFFEERFQRQGLYLMDEPESALSPKRQLDLLRLLARIQRSAVAEVIVATHAPILMAVPGATVLELTRGDIREVDYRETSHFRLYRDFTVDPEAFVGDALAEGDPSEA
ncbi:MAG: AAA family ATPase [Pseudomonadota bacterium]